MTTVLGTRIEALRRSVPRALLISDLHVPGDGAEAVDPLGAALDAAAHAKAEVFVLGDLFDSYVSRRQLAVGNWRVVTERIAAAVRNGTAVTLLVGNRDFLLGDEFVRASGAQLVRGGVRVTLGGADTLLLHGDELCQNDLPYQRAKRWLRSAPVRWLARSLPVHLAIGAAARARARSRMVIAQGDPERFLPTGAAVATAMASGVQRLVFGHIHRPCHGRFERGEYWVLPAYDEAGVGLDVSPSGIAPAAFAGRQPRQPLAPWPPCPFATARC